MGYHLVNAILHSIVTVLFTFTAKVLTKKKFTSLVAGLLFASHPIHTEAVAGVVGRADILACLFFLLALLSYIRYCKYRDKHGTKDVQKMLPSRWPSLFMMAVFTTASMLSKEQGVTVLAVCIMYDIFMQTKLTFGQLLHIYKVSFLNEILLF